MPRLLRTLLGPSLSSLALAVVLAGCGSSAPRLTDPNQILDQALTNVAATKTVHLEASAKGQLNGAALSGILGPMLGLGDLGGIGSVTGGTMKIDGSQLKGDIDVAHSAFHVAASVPAAFFLTADVIGVGGDVYLKSSLSGTKYTKLPQGSLPVPGAGASASPDLTGLSTQLKQAVTDAGIKPTLKGVESVAGKDAYHLTFPLPDTSKIGAAASTGLPSLGTGTVDLWVYVDGTRPAQIEVNSASAQLGTLDLTVTLSDYDKGVTISAPAPADVQAS